MLKKLFNSKNLLNPKNNLIFAVCENFSKKKKLKVGCLNKKTFQYNKKKTS